MIRIRIAKLVRRALTEVCTVPVLLVLHVLRVIYHCLLDTDFYLLDDS